jgi:hypothetical protein
LIGIFAASCLIGLGLIGVLALSNGWLTPRPEPNGPAATERLRVVKIDVRHYGRNKEKENEVKYWGLIGDRSFAGRFGDQVTVEAKLSRPAYAYLIAFRPDGKCDLCFPEREDEPPPRTEQPRYPSEKRSVRYGLSDGTGLVVFAVVASDRPLPPYQAWKARNLPTWGHTEGFGGQVWWDDGDLLDTLTRDGLIGGGRGKGEEALGPSGAVIRLSDGLKKGESVDAVGVLGFVIQKR